MKARIPGSFQILDTAAVHGSFRAAKPDAER